MPKKEIDYSNVKFYKIVCKDPDITDCYVGMTTNFTNRRCHHRNCYENEQDKEHNLLVYKFIREHGGWNNFDMVLIESQSFDNSLEAKQHQRKLIEELHAKLNQTTPYRSQEEKKQYQQEYNEKQNLIKRQQVAQRELERQRQNKILLEQKELKKQRDNAKASCECGGKYTMCNKAKHMKSKKHILYTQVINPESDTH